MLYSTVQYFMLYSKITEFTVIKSNILAFSPLGPGLPCNKRKDLIAQKSTNEHAKNIYANIIKIYT